ncbi:hypothetical protein GCM10009077_07710 [Roseibium denhamense]
MDGERGGSNAFADGLAPAVKGAVFGQAACGAGLVEVSAGGRRVGAAEPLVSVRGG